MAAGDRFFGEPGAYTDKKTGYRVIKPISQDGNRHMYFTSNPFTQRGDELLFSAVRSDAENYYLLNFLTGEYIQLTDLNGVAVSMAYFNKPTDELYYATGGNIYKTHVRTLKTTQLYESQCGDVGPIAVTCDSRYLISRLPDVHSYTNNEMQRIDQPVWRIFALDLQTLSERVIMKRSAPLDHIQCHPARPDWFMYCLWGSGCTHHRIWRANLDGTQGGPIGGEIPNEHRTHEYYAMNGEKVCFHSKYCRYDPAYKNLGRAWGVMDWDGGNEEVFRCPKGTNPGHSIMSSDGKTVVSDGGDSICRMTFDRQSMTCGFEPLAVHNSTDTSNFVHPHPSFSNDDRYIVFATDSGGEDRGNIYLIDLNSK